MKVHSEIVNVVMDYIKTIFGGAGNPGGFFQLVKSLLPSVFSQERHERNCDSAGL